MLSVRHGSLADRIDGGPTSASCTPAPEPPKFALHHHSQHARPCHFPRRLGPNSRRPPRLPVDPRADGQPIPLPRGPAQQLALRPAEEGLCVQVLGFHGHWICSPLPPCCLANQEEQAVDAARRN
ncbi:hypothetical protein SNOG_05248 [Parastagonospora nodorum SN15]|uniref:Uncharacterized protein n=1 Tax=Phaeosphaeria nodorum (strain SN15 / ATCC MYA-4574 / FGSC 10173) TaxID=321614 RepID=Q0USL6_PHANO|nr:hypothetical protein SNOG_05248 [Parastagonospora nodorum SN15]EAT87639.2 hypothetical protein SNOG_05248 [Parastagonospora nodorum SN15]